MTRASTGLRCECWTAVMSGSRAASSRWPSISTPDARPPRRRSRKLRKPSPPGVADVVRAVLPNGEDGGGVPVLGEVPDPEPAAGEVLVENAATGLNRADILQLRGQYPPPRGESVVPGMECAGTIVALGREVSDWRVGERVMAL